MRINFAKDCCLNHDDKLKCPPKSVRCVRVCLGGVLPIGWSNFSKEPTRIGFWSDKEQKKWHSTALIFHSTLCEYVMHVYCLTEINTLNLTTIYKVFAYVIFHDIHSRLAFFSLSFSLSCSLHLCVRWLVGLVILLHFACWFLLICSHIKCEIKYRQQRIFIKGPQVRMEISHTSEKRIMCAH